MQKAFKRWTQAAALMLAVMMFGANVSMAQVTVSLDDVTGRPGETAMLAVDISNVEAGAAIQAFGFDVATGAGITFTGHSTPGTLSGDANFLVDSSPGGLERVGGFAQGTNITTSGNLVYLTFSLDTDGSAGSITLSNFTFNGGTPAVAGSLTANYVVSTRIIAVNDVTAGEAESFEITFELEDALVDADDAVSFNFDLDYDPTLITIDKSMGSNGVIAGGVTTGVIVNGNDVDADTYRIGGFIAPGEMLGDGLFVSLAVTANGVPGMADLKMSGVTFNAGNPVYAQRNGTLTITATNFAPVFTAELGATTLLEDGSSFSFDYDATDANGDALTYTLTSGPGSVDASTGVYSVDPMGNSGSHTVTVEVSDGVNMASSSAALTIHRVDYYEASLAGFNGTPPSASVASGMVTMRMVAGTGTLEAAFDVSGLAGDMTAAHIHFGGVGEAGGVALNLTPTGTSFAMGYDITGMSDLVDAMRSGDAYVNVHSSAYPAGEVRGQVLAMGNAAPSEASVHAPGSVVAAGDPADGLFAVSWLPVSDSNGDTVNYIYQMAMDANFTDTVYLESFGPTNGFQMSVGETAELFDDLTDANPGAVNVGGSVTVYHRVITTDGSLWNAGPAKTLEITRGLVTDTEVEGALPTEFALKGNYPNPFNPSTTISFDLPETADVTIQVMDLLGREVLAVPSQTFTAGANRTAQIDASSLASGIYLYRVVVHGLSASSTQVGTMTLLK